MTLEVANSIDLDNLTQRESEVLYYALRGYSNKDIALKLHLSMRTIESHINQIKIKFNCHSRKDVIEYGVVQGCVNYLPCSLIPRV